MRAEIDVMWLVIAVSSLVFLLVAIAQIIKSGRRRFSLKVLLFVIVILAIAVGIVSSVLPSK